MSKAKDMNTKQLKAIRRLEQALKNCADAGVYLWGVDADLIAVNSRDADVHDHEVQDHVVTVKDHGCYIESAAW